MNNLSFLFISLGEKCQTKWQIKRFLSSKYPEYKNESFYFDWLMGGGLQGVIKSFKNKFILKPENFKPLKIANGYLPYETATNFIFHHDFTGNKIYPLLDECLYYIKKDTDRVIEKYSYLASKTLEAIKNNKVIFIYHGVINNIDYWEFTKSIEELTSNYKFVNVINYNQDLNHIDKVVYENDYPIYKVNYSVNLKEGTEHSWQGNDADWDLVFEEIINNLKLEFNY